MQRKNKLLKIYYHIILRLFMRRYRKQLTLIIDTLILDKDFQEREQKVLRPKKKNKKKRHAYDDFHNAFTGEL